MDSKKISEKSNIVLNLYDSLQYGQTQDRWILLFAAIINLKILLCITLINKQVKLNCIYKYYYKIDVYFDDTPKWS